MELSRRRILAGLAGAVAIATGTVTQAGTVKEHDQLIRLAQDLPKALDTYKRARAKVGEIYREWSPQWPNPEENTVNFSTGKTHRDLLGIGVEIDRPWGKQVVKIGTPECFEASAKTHLAEAERRSKFKSQRGMKQKLRMAERAKAAIEPARHYWSEVERITTASGMTQAKANEIATREALQSLVDQILRFEERTIEGLAIKAQAMEAWGKVDKFHRGFNPHGLDWADHITKSILRHAA